MYVHLLERFSNSYIEAVRSDEIEFMVAQHPWLENDCLLADIILPVATKFEMDDMGDEHNSGTFTFPFIWSGRHARPSANPSATLTVVAKIAEKLGRSDTLGVDYYGLVHRQPVTTDRKAGAVV